MHDIRQALVRSRRKDREGRVGLVSGSGCESLLEELEDIESDVDTSVLLSGDVRRPGRDIRLISGCLRGVLVTISSYRPHIYQLIGNRLGTRVTEDSAVLVDYNHPGAIRHWLQQLMIEMDPGRSIVLVSAVGAVTPDLRVGDIVRMDRFFTSFFNEAPLMRAEHVSPLQGLGDDERLVKAFERFCWEDESGLVIPKPVVHCMKTGPAFETPTDIKVLRGIMRAGGVEGAVVAGMSTLPELDTIAVVNQFLMEKGMPRFDVLPIGIVTNAAGDPNVSHDDVRAAVAVAVREIIRLVQIVGLYSR